MKNLDKELTVPKWVLIIQPKIPQMPQLVPFQNVCPSPKVRNFWKKQLSLGVCSPCTGGWKPFKIMSPAPVSLIYSMLQYHKFLPQDTYSSLPTTQGRRNPHGPMNGPIDPPKFSLIRNKRQNRSNAVLFYDWPPPPPPPKVNYSPTPLTYM